MEDPTFSMENSFGFSLHHASYIFKASLKNKFSEIKINITPEEFVFLFLIPTEGASQRYLTQKALKDKATITRLIDKLVSKEWINRVENTENRREQIISMTNEGEIIKEKLMLGVHEFISTATQGLRPDEIEKSRILLNKVILNLTS